jgi:hypothetical protein
MNGAARSSKTAISGTVSTGRPAAGILPHQDGVNARALVLEDLMAPMRVPCAEWPAE